MTPAERTKRARLAAYAMHAKNDSKERAAKIQASLLRRFEDQVDPDRTLPEEERARRAEASSSCRRARRSAVGTADG